MFRLADSELAADAFVPVADIMTELGMAELRQLALTEYKLQLAAHNAISELLGDTVYLHQELIDACSRCITNNWVGGLPLELA